MDLAARVMTSRSTRPGPAKLVVRGWGKLQGIRCFALKAFKKHYNLFFCCEITQSTQLRDKMMALILKGCLKCTARYLLLYGLQ